MDIIITPITKREIDLHSSYKWEHEYWQDLHDLEQRKSSLDSKERQLYSYLNFSLTNFALDQNPIYKEKRWTL